MGIISVDFMSIIVGYVIGVALMWSLCNTFYGENYDGKETDSKYTRPKFDRRYHMLYGDPPE